VIYTSQFVLLSLHLWPWYCLSFVTWPVAMILSVFCHLPFGHDIVCLLSLTLWPWYCLSFVTYPLAMLLSVFCHLPFGHDIVCLLSLHLWPWYCLSFVSFPLSMILSVFCHLPFGHDSLGLFWCTASGYLFDIFKPFLHSCEIVICLLSVFYSKYKWLIFSDNICMYCLLIAREHLQFCGNLICCSLCLFWLIITYG
jgi:hypothetical protein